MSASRTIRGATISPISPMAMTPKALTGRTVVGPPMQTIPHPGPHPFFDALNKMSRDWKERREFEAFAATIDDAANGRPPRGPGPKIWMDIDQGSTSVTGVMRMAVHSSIVDAASVAELKTLTARHWTLQDTRRWETLQDNLHWAALQDAGKTARDAFAVLPHEVAAKIKLEVKPEPGVRPAPELAELVKKALAEEALWGPEPARKR